MLLLNLLLVPVVSYAEEDGDFLLLNVADALSSEYGQSLKPDVRIYMIGQTHPNASQEMSIHDINSRTGSMTRNKERACQEAFIDALVWLQKRGKAEGGNAIIDIVSMTKFRTLESATQYRCSVGAFAAVVTLQGKVVKVS